MTPQAVHVMVLDGFADWEPAHALAELEFALENFRELKVFSAADEQLWFDMFKHGRLPQSTV